MATLEEMIAEIEARANAATPGPWDMKHPDVDPEIRAPGATLGRVEMEPRDFEFVCAARTDVPRLVKALRHAVEECNMGVGGRPGLDDEIAAILRGEVP